MNRKQSAFRFTLGAAAGCLLLASAAGAQQYNNAAQGVGGQQPSAAAQGLPDVSGIQQKMQEQMMQKMAQQMQGVAVQAAPAVSGGQQPSAAAQGLPDVSGIQQKMQEQMMQQMAQQMQAAVPAAQMQGGAVKQQAPALGGQQPSAAAQGLPDVSGIQQKMQEQMMQQMAQQMQAAVPAAQMQGVAKPQALTVPSQQQVLPAVPSSMQQNVSGMNPAVTQPGSIQIDTALSSVKIDPAIQASINQKVLSSLKENLSGTLMKQNMQQQLMNTPPATGTQP